ncbi:hypothetical protein GQ42DRAFT_161544 [Ramicandelaber brevisporus]|nr:hypothetical protein GQ42DRAFT_161544 [Ramicandelaber brevisporus]
MGKSAKPGLIKPQKKKVTSVKVANKSQSKGKGGSGSSSGSSSGNSKRKNNNGAANLRSAPSAIGKKAATRPSYDKQKKSAPAASRRTRAANNGDEDDDDEEEEESDASIEPSDAEVDDEDVEFATGFAKSLANNDEFQKSIRTSKMETKREEKERKKAEKAQMANNMKKTKKKSGDGSDGSDNDNEADDSDSDFGFNDSDDDNDSVWSSSEDEIDGNDNDDDDSDMMSLSDDDDEDENGMDSEDDDRLERTKMKQIQNAEQEKPKSKRAEIGRLPIKDASGRIYSVEVDSDEEDEEDEAQLSDSLDSDLDGGSDVDMDGESEYGEDADADAAMTDGAVGEKAMSRHDRAMKHRAEIASLSERIMSDADANVGLLKQLREITREGDLVTKQIALLAQAHVYKDIIPDYRIRELSDQEKTAKVSKDVRQKRAIEESLVNNYKQYLALLAEAIKRARQSTGGNSANAGKYADLEKAAMKCYCELMVTKPHFNFSKDIITQVIRPLSRRAKSAISVMCCEAVIKLIREVDVSGEYSLLVVDVMSKMVEARKYRIHPDSIKVLLHLRLREELRPTAPNGTGVNNPPKKTGSKSKNAAKDRKRAAVGEETSHMTRMEKKQRISKETRRDMMEAEAEVSEEVRAKQHTETLKRLFIMLFRILKSAPPADVLSTALECIAKFAHLISVDFFKDLLAMLKTIMQGKDRNGNNNSNDSTADGGEKDDDEGSSDIVSGASATRIGLLCVVTACKLLSGQGEALAIDLRDFYVHLYKTLVPLALNPRCDRAPAIMVRQQREGDTGITGVLVESEVDMALRAIDLMFFKRQTRVPIGRAAAFAKRLLSAAVHLPSPKSIVRCVETVRLMVSKHPQLVRMLAVGPVPSASGKNGKVNGSGGALEGRRSGSKYGDINYDSADDSEAESSTTASAVYLKDIDDPDACNAMSTRFYELRLLEVHPAPEVRDAVSYLIRLRNRSF